MLYARRRPDGPVTRGLAAVGRTRVHELPPADGDRDHRLLRPRLGLFGSVTRVEQLGFVLVVWVVQIVFFSPVAAIFPVRSRRVDLADAYVRGATADTKPGVGGRKTCWRV